MRNATILRQVSLFTFSLLTILQLSAQELSFKYGKVTNDELKMTSYEADTTASAVVIYKEGTTLYQFVANDFRVVYDVSVKIKILKSEGTEYANVTIPYYYNDKNNSTKESVLSIDANAYNLVNGKLERTKMKKEYVFKERIDDNYMQVKFSIPSAKVGSVIEYKYKVQSDFYYTLKEWDIQQEIPVIQNNYELTIPEYFKFNIDLRGGEHVKKEEKAVSQPITIQYQKEQELIQANARRITFSAKDIPALRVDSYVWYPDDYKSKIIFELYGLDFPGTGYRSLTGTWEAIDKLLLGHEEFGRLLKMRNPLRNEMAEISLEGLSTDEKIIKLFTFLKQRISWNQEYSLWGSDMRKSIKEGTANNATLNFILISMLKEANIPAVPIVMSRRSRGILPFLHPSLNKINTMVVGIQNTDSTMVYIDGSVTDGFINVLPPVLLVERARIVSESGGEKWVNLRKVGNNQLRIGMQVIINDDGKLKGEINTSYIGQYASAYRSTHKEAKDSLEFIEKKEANNNIKISSYKQEGLQSFSPTIRESIAFTKDIDTTGEYIYINPMIFKHIAENPFVQEERMLPVEFPYQQQIRTSVIITIPDNYEIDEMPENGRVLLRNPQEGNCIYSINRMNNQVSLNYQFARNRFLFTINEYTQLQEFFEAIADKNNQMIVLKKKSE